MRLAGKVAMVTGAAQGIGAAIADEFAKQGAVVYAVDRSPSVKATCTQICEAGGKAFSSRLDITDHQAYSDLVSQIVEAQGSVDILINNAAIAYYEELLQSSLEHWREIQAVNLEAQYIGCKLVAPHMMKAGWGRIVNIASTQAIATEATVGAYAASKGGIVQFTRSCAVAWAADNIQANAVLPGWIDTDLTKRAREQIDGLHDKVLARTPAARWGEIADFAGIAVFLSSSASDFVTGTAIPVDGGFSVMG